jgi:hypothetical protein
MLTAPLHSTFPKLDGRLLIIVCSYRGGIGNPPPFSLARTLPWSGRFGRLADRLMFLNLRQFIAANRDFFANARTLAYQAGLVGELLGMSAPAQVTIALDRAFETDEARSTFESFGSVSIRDPGDLARGCDDADAVVVVYPEALGLGWEPLEARLAEANAYLLNGRRRIQPFNARAQRLLRWHRLWATTRIPELVASVAIVPVAAVLAAWDAMRGKS